MIEGIILTKIVESALKNVKQYLNTAKKKLVSKEYDLQAAISQHLKIVENWSSQISFRDLGNPKAVTDTYIELNLSLTPRRLKMATTRNESLPFNEIFQNESSHLVVLGQLGAGKTTTMKKICQELLHSEETVFSEYNFPVVIPLRRMANYNNIASPLFMKLYHEFALSIDFETKNEPARINQIIARTILLLLDNLGIIIILDGYDEIQDETLKRGVTEDLGKLALGLNNSKLILTSRTADYNINIENTKEYEIDSLSEKQINLFAYNWFKKQDISDEFVKLLKSSPFYDTAIRPLTLAHLCAIFERDGRIPEKPKSVYKKIINLLLEEWNAQKSVVKNSRYSNFEIDRKFEFLSHLAYFLTVEFGKSNFTREELSKCYELICNNFNLPPNELHLVMDELESHNGLFLQTGYESYEFAHRSLQEYLTAEYIIRLPNIPTERNILFALPNELAIAISLSSDASTYFATLFFDRLNVHLESLEFIKVFMNRLVIELPNFRASARLGMIALFIYTIYTDKYLERSKEDYSDFLEVYAKFIRIDSVKKSINMLVESNYDKEKGIYLYSINDSQYEWDAFYEDEQNNIKFKKRTRKEEFETSNFTPSYIYLNKHLLK